MLNRYNVQERQSSTDQWKECLSKQADEEVALKETQLI